MKDAEDSCLCRFLFSSPKWDDTLAVFVLIFASSHKHRKEPVSFLDTYGIAMFDDGNDVDLRFLL